jgi:FkbM family methyltransferase
MNAEYFNKLINDGDTANCAITSELLLNKTNPVCFDIGAFHGIWGEGIMLENPDAIVHFFEPNPTNFEALKKNIGDREGAHFYGQAISDKEGTLEFLVDGPTSNSREDIVTNDARTITVKCSTIDPFFKNNEYVDIVKIDTEGHELHVLRTLLPYVKEKRVGALVTEFSPFWYGSDPEEVYNATDLLYDYFDVYKYCYALSRHGEVFTVQITPENLDEFIYDKFVRHIQTDIYFMNEEIRTIPVYQFKYGTYYA